MNLKILIVDDERIKIGKIREALQQTGKIDVEDMEDCMTVDDAIRKIRNCRYDLIILDVLLPYKIDQEVSSAGGTAVLKCITTMDQAKKPLCIIGLTGYEESLNQCESVFADAACLLIKYQGDSDEWRKKLKRKVIWLYEAKKELEAEKERMAEQANMGYQYDIAIITAAEVEFQAVLALDLDWKEESVPGDPQLYYTAEATENGKKKRLLLARQKYMGMPAASALVTRILAAFRPKCVCMVGITGGKKGEVRIGDLIVADESWDYGSGKWKESDGNLLFLPEPHYISLPPAHHAFFTRDFSRELWEIRNQWNKTAAVEKSLDIRLHLGALASGAAVIQNDQILRQYIEPHQRKVLGIDMETYGVYYACENAPQPAPRYLSIKSVSDYVDADKNDKDQKYCAYVSARFLYAVWMGVVG